RFRKNARHACGGVLCPGADLLFVYFYLRNNGLKLSRQLFKEYTEPLRIMNNGVKFRYEQLTANSDRQHKNDHSKHNKQSRGKPFFPIFNNRKMKIFFPHQ